MSRIAQQGRQSTGNRAFGRRFRSTGAAVGALALALPLTLSLAPQALAQNSGIYINNDVLNNLGPGPAPAPGAPLAPPPAALPPAAPPAAASPVAPGALPVQPLVPQAQSNGSLSFQTHGSGNYVVTRPGTLLFPPLEPPTSTLAPGFTDNHAARTEAMNNAFAEGPEPSSQLLIPLAPEEAAPGDDSVVVFMGNLPPADPAASAGDAPVLTLRRPGLATPDPAPRKPEVSAEMLAETGATTIDDTTAALAPEFQSRDAAPAPMKTTPVEKAPLAEAPAPAPAVETAESSPAEGEPMAKADPASEATMRATATADAADQTAPPAAAAQSKSPAETPAETMVATKIEDAKSDATAGSGPVSLLPPAASSAPAEGPQPSADVPAPVTQTAALPSGGEADRTAATPAPGAADAGSVEDISFIFESNSAELSTLAQNELRSLAQSMRSREDGRIQVLGFASAEGGSDDLARRLALSRALKVRTFLIDAGVPSARIQVRSLGAQSDGGPANRVDIRPIDS